MLVGILITNNIHAQGIRVAPEVGLQINSVSANINGYDDYQTKARTGLRAGSVVDIPLNRGLSLQPGLFYAGKGFIEDYSYFGLAGNTTLRIRERTEYRINYLEIPVNLQYRFPIARRMSLFLGAGPYVAFALGGKYEYTRERFRTNGNPGIYDETTEDGSLEIGNNKNDDDVKSTDAGINLNIGIMSFRGLYLRGNLGIGLSNIVPGGDQDNRIRNMGGSITVGYLLGR